MPAPRFFDGLKDVWRCTTTNGHASYILGERHHFGVWYFFPVTLAVKTPLALLVLVGWRSWTAWRKRLKIGAPLAYCAVILAIAMSSRINIGVRHVLPLYAGLAVIAGVGAASCCGIRAAAGVAQCLRCSGYSRGRWFRALWRIPTISPTPTKSRADIPENFVAESDLDWGQDMHRVGDFLKQAGATEVTFTPYNVTYLQGGARVSQGDLQQLVSCVAGVERGEPGRLEGVQPSGLGR